jgi:hypothetical protein
MEARTADLRAARSSSWKENQFNAMKRTMPKCIIQESEK